MLETAERPWWWLIGLLSICGVALWMTSVPESFTVDDCNYLASVLALQEGGVTMPGTEGLSPSEELCAFDPQGRGRVVESTPVAPTVPPLYAPFALPFSYLGWSWLQLLNVLSFLVVATLVFAITKRLTQSRHAPWVGVAAFVLGGFSMDYAQGLWPQMLSAALTTGAVWLAIRARDDDDGGAMTAAAAGLLAGMAAGVRYQNVVFAAALGLTILLWARRRQKSSLAYAVGVALPLCVTAAINSERIGSFNPISKGPRYMTPLAGVGDQHRIVDWLMTLYVRIVDYSAHPPFASEHARLALPKDPLTGVFSVVGGLKKSLLQSAPWMAIALILLVVAWTAAGRMSPSTRRHVRALSIVVATVLALFSWAGLERHDGWGFNQRYLLELVPLIAVAAAVAVDDWKLDAASLAIGSMTGVAAALVPLSAVAEHPFRQRALMIVPLGLAAMLVAAWCAARWRRRLGHLRPMLLAACIGWALAVHIGDDMVAARGLRDWHGVQRSAVAAVLPWTPVALIAGPGQNEGLCGLHLDHDLVMIDPWLDDGKAAPKLIDELLAAGRRVFVVGGLPEPILRIVVHDRRLRFVARQPLPIAEIVGSLPAAAPTRPD